MFSLLRSQAASSVTFFRGLLEPGAAAPDDAADLEDAVADAGDDDPFEEPTQPVFTEEGMVDPVVQGLPDNLRYRHPKKDPESYGFIRTLGEKYGVPDDVIEKVQAGYASALPSFRTFVSTPDQIPGFRRMVIFGPGFTNNGHSILGVTRDGFFMSGSLDAEASSSVAEIIDLARNRVPWRPGLFIDLNKHSSSARMTSHMATLDILKISGSRDHMLTVRNDPGFVAFWRTFKHLVDNRISRHVELARWALAGSMAPDAMRMMRSTQNTSSSDALWFSGFDLTAMTRGADRSHPDRWFGVPLEQIHVPDRAEARTQAVKSFPSLAQALMGPLAPAVDARTPLAPRIAEHFHVPPAGVRNIVGLTWQRQGVKPRDADKQLRDIMSLPRHLAPQNRAEHRACRQLADFSSPLALDFSGTVKHFSRGGSPWRYAAQIEAAPAGDIMDMSSYLVDKLFYPALLRKIRDTCIENGTRSDGIRYPEAARSQLRGGFLGSLSVPDMFSANTRWHRNINRHMDHLDTLSNGGGWTALEPALLDLDAGITGRELASTSELKAQGKDQNHCVGGYDGGVIGASPRNLTLIWSLERDGLIVGTVEIRGSRRVTASAAPREGVVREPVSAADHGWTFTVNQNRGHGNSHVPADVEKAGSDVCRHLAGLPVSRIAGYIASMEEVRRSRSIMRDLPREIRAAGYDIWDDAAFAKAWDELSQYLPRGMRKAGLAAFVAGQDMGMVELEDGAPLSRPFWDFSLAELENSAEAAATDCENPLAVRQFDLVHVHHFVEEEQVDHDLLPF